MVALALALSALLVGPTTTLAFTAGENGHPTNGPYSDLKGGSATFTLPFQGGGAMTLRMLKAASPDMSGTDVKSWQRLLADRGHSPGSVDGYWGDKSVSALKNFQKAKGLTADGVLGPSTAERLIEG